MNWRYEQISSILLQSGFMNYRHFCLILFNKFFAKRSIDEIIMISVLWKWIGDVEPINTFNLLLYDGLQLIKLSSMRSIEIFNNFVLHIKKNNFNSIKCLFSSESRHRIQLNVDFLIQMIIIFCFHWLQFF